MKKIKKEYYLISVLLVCFGLLTLFVTSGKALLVDEVFYNGLIRAKNNYLTSILYVITNIGSTVGVICLLSVMFIIFYKKKSISDFKYVVINVGFAAFTMKVLKHIIKRIRPSWKWIVQSGFSYPSGHTISAVVLYGTLILLVYKKMHGKLRKPLIICFSLMIALISISRIYFGVHYLTDVIGSLILGSIILIISSLFMDKEFSNDKNKNK